MAVIRETSFTVDGSPDDLMACAIRALGDMSCNRFEHSGLHVTARTMFNWRSLGEVMTVALSEVEGGATRVSAESRSKLKTVIFDWGANNANLRRFEKAFMTRVAALGKEPMATR
jgi:hypothetical protein